MNKKLLSSSALVGAMLISGAALAEFKVGGDVTATYKMGSDESSTNGLASGESIGNETNITFSGNKDLANGMKAQYAGKLELDGPSTDGYDHEYELKLVGASGLYVAFANDGGQSNRTSMTPFVSYPIGSTANAVTPIKPTFNGDSFNGSVHTSNNIGIGGKLGGGDFVLRYAPNAGGIEGDDVATSNNINADSGTANGSGYMAAYNGKFGPLGLNLGYTVVQKADDSVTSTDDIKEARIGVVYTAGAFKVGADYITYEAGAASDVGDAKTYIVGAAYAVDSNTTVGIYHQSTEDERAAGGYQDEDMKMISIGYNLGGASVALSVVDIEGLGNTANGTNSDYQGLMITTKVGF